MMSAPTVLKTSWSLLITGISASMTLQTRDPLPAGRGNEWGRGPESASFPLSSALSSGASTHWTQPAATCPLPAGRARRGRGRGTRPAGSCGSGAGESRGLRSRRLRGASGARDASGRGAWGWDPTRVVSTLGSEARVVGGKRYAYLVLRRAMPNTC